MIACTALSGCAITSDGNLAGCTPAPPPPPHASSDWSEAVHPNCRTDLGRLGLWTGKQTPLGPTSSPAGYFAPVGAGSIAPQPGQAMHVYVVVHGWAPSFKSVVKANPGIQWWNANATSGGTWASDWAWAPTSVQDPNITVTDSGVFQLISQHDPSAVVLGYSWLDDSATSDSWYGDTINVYQSEAYTCVNGLRLATALAQALDASFWSNPQSRLHLIGHSHGAKVATVAALRLQRASMRVDHLTVLDAPDGEIPLMANGANLLPFHLDQLTITATPAPSVVGAFVDSYVSYFGVGYTGSPALDRVVEVGLDPTKLYWFTDPGDMHAYAGTWYAGAAAAAAKFALPSIGLDWPAPPPGWAPALKQPWTAGVTNRGQWLLSRDGSSVTPTYRYGYPSLTITPNDSSGNVQFNDGVLAVGTFGPPGPGAAWFKGSFDNDKSPDRYGIGFDLDWQTPADGDYLVVTVQSPDERKQEVVLVVDGKSLVNGLRRFPMTIAADISHATFEVFYLPASTTPQGGAVLRNFRSIRVQDANGDPAAVHKPPQPAGPR